MARKHAVEVKSAATSKINWTSAIGPLISVSAIFGFDLTWEQAAAAVTLVQMAQSAATIVMRTWFTKSITPSSI